MTEPLAARPTPLYFAVSTRKLLIMSCCTLAFYEFYWFYKNWCHVKENEKSAISPTWRTVFAPFYCYSLFSKIRTTAQENNVEVALPAGPLAAGWIVLSLLLELPDPYGLLFSFPAIAMLVPVQVAANKINLQLVPDHDPNARFTPGNIVAAVMGSLVLIAVIYSAFAANSI